MFTFDRCREKLWQQRDATFLAAAVTGNLDAKPYQLAPPTRLHVPLLA